MNRDNYKLAAVGIAAVLFMLVYHQGPDVATFSGRPTGDQWATIAAAIGAVVAAIKGWKGEGGGGGVVPTLDLLQSLKTIIDQFKVKGLPDGIDMTLTWAGESYELKWAKRVKPEPKPQ